MASGKKLPNTNLNLIQDIDMIDHADINAIAQATEANATAIGRMQLKSPIKYLDAPTIADLDTTLEFEFLGRFSNGPSELTGFIYFNQQFYDTVSVDSSRRQFVQSFTDGRMFTRVTYDGNPFTPWREVGRQDDPVEAVLTAGKFNAARFKLYRIGRLCVTAGYIHFTEEIPPGGNHNIGAVPVGFRPPVNVQTWPVSNSTKESVALMFLADGTIAVYNYSSTPLAINTSLTATLTWITND